MAGSISTGFLASPFRSFRLVQERPKDQGGRRLIDRLPSVPAAGARFPQPPIRLHGREPLVLKVHGHLQEHAQTLGELLSPVSGCASLPRQGQGMTHDDIRGPVLADQGGHRLQVSRRPGNTEGSRGNRNPALGV
jgi:hypothetical protein